MTIVTIHRRSQPRATPTPLPSLDGVFDAWEHPEGHRAPRLGCPDVQLVPDMDARETLQGHMPPFEPRTL